MKISKDRLKQLVQEELAMSFGGVAPTMDAAVVPASMPKANTDGEGYMAKQNLWKIAEYTHQLYELMSDDDCLEPWVEEKIAVAAYMMDSVGHYIEYMKHRQHEAAEGDVDTLEVDEEPEAPYEEEMEDDEEFELDMEEPSEEYEDEGEEEYEDEESEEMI